MLPSGSHNWRETALRSTVLLLAALCLGMASLCFSGRFEPQQFFFMVGGLALLILGVALPDREPLGREGHTAVELCLGAALLVYFAVTVAAFVPGIVIGQSPLNTIRPYWFLLAVGGFLAAMCVYAPLQQARIYFVLFIGVFALNAIWVLHNTHSVIDVWVAHQASCQALLAGVNPFAITYPDIYGPGSPFMPPGAVKDGMVQSGYPYPPLTLIMSLPGYLLAQDVRYMGILSMCATAVFLAVTARGRIGILLGCLLLLMPYSMLLVAFAWTETHILLLLAMFAYCAVHRPRWAPWLFGLFLVSKQHLFVVAPLALLAFPQPRTFRPILIFALKAILAGVIVTLPWVLWNPAAFDRSVMYLFHGALDQAVVPRKDAVTFWAAMQHYGFGNLPAIAGVIVLAFVTVWTLLWNWRSRYGIAACVAGISLSMLALHSFSRHAFCNHYYFIFGGLLCSVAALAGMQAPSATVPDK